MKKRKLLSNKKISKWLKKTELRGLFAFLIMLSLGSVFYVYAITAPPEPTAVTGIVGLYQGFSTNDYTAAKTSYANANQECSSYGSGAHICSEQEILQSYNFIFADLPTTGTGWINGGPPGYKAYANDCGGWQKGGPVDNAEAKKYLGRYWDFAQKQGFMRTCNSTSGGLQMKFACCL